MENENVLADHQEATTPIVHYPLSIIHYQVIGIPNNQDFILNDEVKTLLQQEKIFSGGKRHYELVKHLLPRDHHWINIAGDIAALFQQYKQLNQPIVVFASGDPLFYGFVNTIKKNHPDAQIKVYPHFSSLQVLCQRATIPYQHIVNTSVHGRSWEELDSALIHQPHLIGVLTDAVKTPSAIAQRMLDYQFYNYRMMVGEALESDQEKITSLSLTQAVTETFNELNCVLLIKTKQKQKQFGIADTEFEGLENRPNMITKMPVRLVSLSQLNLHNSKTLWDIGFCTGSVSIEAKAQFPHLTVIAFEKRQECNDIFEINTLKHSTPGITKVMGDFFNVNLNQVPAPDAVFIGGHGNQLEELIHVVDQYLITGGRIVMNAVKEESKETFKSSVEKLNYELLQPIHMRVDEYNPIIILTAKKSEQ